MDIELALLIACALSLIAIFFFCFKQQALTRAITRIETTLGTQQQQHTALEQTLVNHIHQLEKQLLSTLSQHKEALIKSNHESSQQAQHALNGLVTQQMVDIREQLNHSFKYHADSLSKHVASLNHEVRNSLKQISTEVHKQLNEGFEKTTQTFTDVVKRLTIIDEAQKRITELSTHVIDLQSVFQDKRARGALGEVQLENLIQNVIPSQHYAMQYSLSNQTRVDCALFLPEPTGILTIDAKFPLESYQMLATEKSNNERKKLQTQFKQAIKKHIQDIHKKYIIENETADAAIMFIPAEAIFAEIHAHHPDLVAFSHQQKVWLTSPNTLMAILTTARAVIKDDATKKQVHIVQEHLNLLAKDFSRFEKRMHNLSKHIEQANQDVNEINTSAKKISQRFHKIEQLEIDAASPESLALQTDQE